MTIAHAAGPSKAPEESCNACVLLHASGRFTFCNKSLVNKSETSSTVVIPKTERTPYCRGNTFLVEPLRTLSLAKDLICLTYCKMVILGTSGDGEKNPGDLHVCLGALESGIV